MATSRRLSDGWTLTDGIFKPFLLAHPMDVVSALREQGLIPKNPCGTQFLQEEWVYLHTFSYALRFALPEDDDEVAALYFSGLCGAGTILINGEVVWAFVNEPAHIPITCCHLKAGENLLEVRFAPTRERALFGITDEVFLRTTNYLMLMSSRFSGTESTISCSTQLETFTAGKYVFKYMVSLDDQAVQNFEFIERLKALSRAKIAHELPIPSPVHWDAASPDESSYTVRLSIERMGIGCELVREDVALLRDGYAPQRIVKLPQGCASERTLQLIVELGAEAVAVDMQKQDEDNAQPLFCPNYLRYGLLTVDAALYQPLPALRAIVPLELLKEKAGDMDYWPSDAPFWKLLGAEPLDVAAYEQRFGVNATGDARRCIEYSRTLQAQQLETDLAAQMGPAVPVMIEMIDPLFVPISRALVDPNFEKRPAFESLKAAWKNE